MDQTPPTTPLLEANTDDSYEFENSTWLEQLLQDSSGMPTSTRLEWTQVLTKLVHRFHRALFQ